MLPRNSEQISISLPTWLIELVDEHCCKNVIGRSSFFQRAIRHYLLHEHDDVTVWESLYRQLGEKS